MQEWKTLRSTKNKRKMFDIERVRTELLDRFIRYVKIDTQSSYDSNSSPSTTNQLDLLKLLKDELKDMGLEDVSLDENGYLIAHIDASEGFESIPKLCFFAHVDTSPDMSGKDVNPQIIENYDGGNIVLDDSGYTLNADVFCELKGMSGHTIITTDGRTLLGADDKAGVSEIMTLVDIILSDRSIKHGPLRICFTPDEEIGKGVDNIDLRFLDADFGYTVDGGGLGELEYECFNAASVTIDIKGTSIHPGYAKGKMINAIDIFCEIHNMLPCAEKPQYTEGYEGFYHITNASGTVSDFSATYIIRDFDTDKFQARKDYIKKVVEDINVKYNDNIVSVYVEDSYYNMKDKVLEYPFLIEVAKEAMLKEGITPKIRPIRGGTDGARLSFMDLPCPNIFAGGHNFHGRYEYVSLDDMFSSVKVLLNIVNIFAS